MTDAITATARDSILRLAATHVHAGDLKSAAHELSAQPYWQRHRKALDRGLRAAAVLVAECGSPRAVEVAIGL